MIKQTLMILWRSKVKNAILIVQFLLAFVAIFFLFNKSIEIYEEYSQPLGYTLEDRIGGSFSNLPAFKTQEELTKLYSMLKAALEEINASEHVIHAGYLGRTPYAGNWSSNGYTTNVASIDGVEAFGLEFIQGGNFTEDMKHDPYNYVILNEASWRDFSPEGENVVGAHFIWPSDTVDQTTKEPHEQILIAGVVKDYIANGRFNWRTYDANLLFLSALSDNEYNLNEWTWKHLSTLRQFVVHFQPQSRNKIEKVVYDAFKTHMPNINFRLNFFDEADARTAKFEWLQFGMFLFICLVLFAIIIVGVIGVTNENLSKRLKEIGIRVALGSTEQQIISQFIIEMGILTAISITLGATLLSIFMGFNALVILFATLILIIVISVCTYLPTTKTARIKPNIALHYE